MVRQRPWHQDWTARKLAATAFLLSKGEIHRAVAAYHLGKLLRHHRLLCCDADRIDVRGDHLDRGDSAAKVEWVDCGLRLANRGAFLRRAPRRRDSQRTMAGALECRPSARPLRSRGGAVRRNQYTAGAPSD